MALSVKQNKAKEVFLSTGDKLQAVKVAYNCSDANASTMACQVFNSPKMIKELSEYSLKKSKTITKEDYIDKALDIHDSLDKTEANAPRYYDLAGKALGYIGANVEQKTVNNTLNITNVDIKAIANDANALLDLIRKQIADNSQT